MKKIRLVLAVVVVLSIICSNLYAYDVSQEFNLSQISQTNIAINGEYLRYEDVPIYVNKSMYIPLRSVCNKLKASISVEGSTIIINKGNRKVKFDSNGDNRYTKKEGNIYVPLRKFADSLGVTFTFNNIVLYINDGSGSSPTVLAKSYKDFKGDSKAALKYIIETLDLDTTPLNEFTEKSHMIEGRNIGANIGVDGTYISESGLKGDTAIATIIISDEFNGKNINLNDAQFYKTYDVASTCLARQILQFYTNQGNIALYDLLPNMRYGNISGFLQEGNVAVLYRGCAYGHSISIYTDVDPCLIVKKQKNR